MDLICPKHNEIILTTPDNYEKSFYGLPCCAKAGQAQTVLDKNLEELKNLALFRKHEIIEESLKDYKTQDSKLSFKCLIHNQVFVTTRRNYRRSKYGLKCCQQDPKILPNSEKN